MPYVLICARSGCTEKVPPRRRDYCSEACKIATNRGSFGATKIPGRRKGARHFTKPDSGLPELLCLDCSKAFQPQHIEDELCRCCTRLYRAREYAREYGREYSRRRYAEKREDPEKWAEYLDYQRVTMQHRRASGRC